MPPDSTTEDIQRGGMGQLLQKTHHDEHSDQHGHKKRRDHQRQYQDTNGNKKWQGIKGHKGKIGRWLFLILVVLFLGSDIKTPNVKNISDSTYINNNSYYKQLTNISTKINHQNTRKQNNKLQHIKNGNYHLNVLHWNKGNTLFKNKITQIDQIMDKYKPHIISLCEASI